MDLKGRHFLKLLDYTQEEITYLINLAADLKVTPWDGSLVRSDWTVDSAKEGNVARSEMPVGSTLVQDKAYVERAGALAIANNCTEIYFENCKFIGRQDTLYGGTGVTAAFYDCSIYGSTDYIYGGMTAVFAKCDLVFNTSENSNDAGYITAAQHSSGRG